MEAAGWAIFLGAVFVGSYVQAVTGFAMGMIVIAVVGASGTIGLPVLTAAASLITMVNVAFALVGHTQAIDRRIFLWLGVGQIPAIGLGVAVMTVLDAGARDLLQVLLGLFITLGCLSMMIRPKPLSRPSPSWACLTAGIAGGVVGGMFSASGPIMGWFTYRQPLELMVITARHRKTPATVIYRRLPRCATSTRDFTSVVLRKGRRENRLGAPTCGLRLETSPDFRAFADWGCGDRFSACGFFGTGRVNSFAARLMACSSIARR